MLVFPFLMERGAAPAGLGDAFEWASLPPRR